MREWHEVGVAVYVNADATSQFCLDLFGDPLVMESVLVGKGVTDVVGPVRCAAC
jgi:hypothetical protein